MKAYLFIFLLLSFSLIAVENEKEIKDKSKTKGKEKTNSAELKPDKELLLFLTEFTDSQGDWVDPEIFNQSEITNSNIEFKEKQNEDHPNNN